MMDVVHGGSWLLLNTPARGVGDINHATWLVKHWPMGTWKAQTCLCVTVVKQYACKCWHLILYVTV